MFLPTLRQLQYLVAVVELRHFGLAAARCGATQSTLSAGIQDLEGLLGVQLMERTKRKVLPTPLGLEIAARAEALLGDAAEIVTLAKMSDGPLAGPLKLGVIPTIGPFLLPRVLPGIRAAHPELVLQLVEEQSSRLVEMLNAGTLDAALLAFPYPLGNLEHVIFWRENFLLALPKGHDLIDTGQITVDRLTRERLLLLQEGHCLTDHALSACRLEGMRSQASFQGTSLYTLLQMVAGGQGMTFVPEMAASDSLFSTGEIALAPLDEPGPHREIGIAWRPASARKEGFRLLGETMAELLT